MSLGVQDSAEVQADETSLSAVMSVDSGHRVITVEAAADVCKGPLCCGGGEAHLQSVLQSDLGPAMAGGLNRRGVLRYTHVWIPLEHSTSPLHNITDATRRKHELALCDPMPHRLGIGSTHVGPGRTPTVHTCSPLGEGRGVAHS